ncbi:MAG: anaerobic ribonucleoside-triphosphate reductase activating protein [Rikenellaceae bacterium]|nr:anaerobic ribonucleoside-triphosphate reductase activating protein [Rikenellaceae bacterium]
MLKYYNFDIVFAEIPGEVTLALNITGCPNNCAGCHSPHLREDTGQVLDDDELLSLIERYGRAVTCVCFMGGDNDPQEVARLAGTVRSHSTLRTGWYSGRDELPGYDILSSLDYIKTGPYRKEAGPLGTPATNQRMYRITDGTLDDITRMFLKK